jgi:hypothetical protein
VPDKRLRPSERASGSSARRSPVNYGAGAGSPRRMVAALAAAAPAAASAPMPAPAAGAIASAQPLAASPFAAVTAAAPFVALPAAPPMALPPAHRAGEEGGGGSGGSGGEPSGSLAPSSSLEGVAAEPRRRESGLLLAWPSRSFSSNLSSLRTRRVRRPRSAGSGHGRLQERGCRATQVSLPTGRSADARAALSCVF